jgi:large subunit ribosomal protein L15
MQLNTITSKSKRIRSRSVGRGGKRGKTSGRGGKGQTARAGHKIRPEIRDMIKKLPKRRGHGKNRSRTVRIDRIRYVPVSLAALDAAFGAGDVVNAASIVKKGVVRARAGRAPLVKVLATGEVTKALSLSGLKVSAGAKAAIEKSGGSVL